MSYNEGKYMNYGYTIKKVDGMFSLVYDDDGRIKTIDKPSTEEAILEFEQRINLKEAFRIG